MEFLLVIDMQNDFIDGALGTKEAEAIVDPVIKKIQEFKGTVLYTRDTHQEDYLGTQEGRLLPVVHCIEGSTGWQLNDKVLELDPAVIVNKPSFGSMELCNVIKDIADSRGEEIESITLIGLCTDICVISNAMILKAAFPEVPLSVDSSCCAGVTPESHINALEAMKVCQISVI